AAPSERDHRLARRGARRRTPVCRVRRVRAELAHRGDTDRPVRGNRRRRAGRRDYGWRNRRRDVRRRRTACEALRLARRRCRASRCLSQPRRRRGARARGRCAIAPRIRHRRVGWPLSGRVRRGARGTRCAPVNALLIALGLWGYAYVGYPIVLVIAGWRTRPRSVRKLTDDLPRVSIVLPVYNEAAVIADTLEAVLALDYPADRRQILVISDASTDATEAIVAGFASRGVELASQRVRRGKTAAENAAWPRLSGDIVLCTDASVRVHAAAVRALVAEFADPSVGVASGRDVSVSRTQSGESPGESAYVGYEMRIRDFETRAGGIVGASGCLYAIRAHLHR